LRAAKDDLVYSLQRFVETQDRGEFKIDMNRIDVTLSELCVGKESKPCC
jgi:hypothetical protein